MIRDQGPVFRLRRPRGNSCGEGDGRVGGQEVRRLGVWVRIKDRKGKGKIVIEYHTVDDYERVVEMLRGKGSS